MIPTPGAPTNSVRLKTPPNPFTYSPQQTNAAYNWNTAQAYRQGDQRASSKPFQRAGMSSSKGTQYLGASDAANAYSQGMASAEASRMQDAYANANMQLQDQVERDRYSNALMGLQEDAAQQQWMHNYQSMNNAMNFMTGMNPQSLLSGLL